MTLEPRIVYLGTPDFAVQPLSRLVEEGFNVVGVVTNPDKPAGRGQRLQESPVKRFAVARGIPVLQPGKFRDETFLDALRAWRADLQIVVAFKMLPEVVWNMPPLGTVNLHASLLPDYRGAAPIHRAVMNGETRSGVTTFLLRQEMDTGRVIFREEVEIGPRDTAGDLHDTLMYRGAELLLKTARAMAAGDYPLVEQDPGGRSPKLAPKIFKEDMQIDWRWPGPVIYNHIRGLSPFPAAWTTLRHRQQDERVTLKIFAADWEPAASALPAGTLTGGERLSISVEGGTIHVTSLQLSGKKQMTAAEFLRGFPLDRYLLDT
jgi:methionyl-tRNA formyltransferase